MVKISELTKDYYKSGEVAKMLGVSTRTVQNYAMRGYFEEMKQNNRRYISKDNVIALLRDRNLLDENERGRKDVIYARVDTDEQIKNGEMAKQLSYLKDFVILKNPKSLEIVTDVGLAIDEERKGLEYLMGMVQQDLVDRIFITKRESLTKYGFTYLNYVCMYHETDIVVLDELECDD